MTLVLKPGLVRCVICRRESTFERDVPKRCTVASGGCGTRDGMTVLRMPKRARGTAGYAAPGGLTIPQQMAAFEEARSAALVEEA